MKLDRRKWLLDTAAWPYVEMEWDDLHDEPQTIKWQFRDLTIMIGGAFILLCGVPDADRTAKLVAVDDPAGSAHWRRTGEPGTWHCDFNPKPWSLDIRDRAEHLAINFLAQLRRSR